MLIVVLWNVGHVEIRVALIRELLELGVKRFLVTVSYRNEEACVITYPSEANFVAKVVKATNTILGILEVVVLDKAKSVEL